MKEKSFEWWTRKDFETLPDIEELAVRPTEADSLVILPTRRMHDSGFRIMHFAVIVGGKPICRLAGSSDVMKIGGIGGYNGNPCEPHETVGWSIDCLKTSGLLRLFCDSHIKLSPAFSTFEVFYMENEKGGKL